MKPSHLLLVLLMLLTGCGGSAAPLHAPPAAAPAPPTAHMVATPIKAALATTCGGKACTSTADCNGGPCYQGTCWPLGVTGAASAGTCTLWTQATSYQESSPMISTGSDPAQLVDVLYPPPGTTPNGKVLIAMHGGGFTSGTPLTSDARATGLFFVKQGFVVVSIGTRLASPTYPTPPGWIAPAAISDFRCGARWAAANVASFGGDPAHMGVLGASSGAGVALAGLASTAAGADDGTCADGQTGVPAIREFLGVSGVYNFQGPLTTAATAAVTDYLGCAPSGCPATAATMSPQFYFSPTGMPITLFHWTGDTLIPSAQSTNACTAAVGAGQNATCVMTAGAYHDPALFLSAWPVVGCTIAAHALAW